MYACQLTETQQIKDSAFSEEIQKVQDDKHRIAKRNRKQAKNLRCTGFFAFAVVYFDKMTCRPKLVSLT